MFKYFHYAPKSPEWEELHNYKHRPVLIPASTLRGICCMGSPSIGMQWEYAMGNKTPPELSDLPAIKHGNFYEPIAYRDFIAKSNWGGIYSPGMIVHEKYPFIGATTDAFLGDGTKLYCMEIKCPHNPDNMPESAMNIDNGYIIQNTTQMACSKIHDGILHFYSPERESISFHMKYNDDLFKQIVAKGQQYVDSVDNEKKITRNSVSQELMTQLLFTKNNFVKVLKEF